MGDLERALFREPYLIIFDTYFLNIGQKNDSKNGLKLCFDKVPL